MPRTVLIPLLLLLATTRMYADEQPLLVARHLGETQYAGWTYGSDPAKKQVNCVQFIAVVLEKLLGRQLSSAETDAIYIRGIDGKDLNKLIVDGDERIKGVQYALTKVLKRGMVVEASGAESGDFIQYWIRKSDGQWMGHSALIEAVSHRPDGTSKATIYSANKSTNGVRASNFQLELQGADRQVYLVRYQDH